MATDDVVLIGATNLQQRSRTTSNGVKQRYTVEVSGTTFGVNTDPKALSKGPAEAIAEHLRQRILDIKAVASKATIKAREAAQRAFNHVQEQKRASAEKRAAKTGTTKPTKPKQTTKAKEPKAPKYNHPKQELAPSSGAWAQKRYAGGRLGPMAPNQSDKMFHDSGRLAASVVAGPTDKSWVINVAANRFDPSTFNGGAGALAEMYARLVQLVPEFGNLALLADALPIRRAIVDATKAMVARAEGKTSDLRWQMFSRGIGLARQIGRLVA